jgi:hypothetical protein
MTYRQAEPVERLDVGVAVRSYEALQPGVVDVEGVRVLHHELAAAQDAGAGRASSRYFVWIW